MPKDKIEKNLRRTKYNIPRRSQLRTEHVFENAVQQQQQQQQQQQLEMQRQFQNTLQIGGPEIVSPVVFSREHFVAYGRILAISCELGPAYSPHALAYFLDMECPEVSKKQLVELIGGDGEKRKKDLDFTKFNQFDNICYQYVSFSGSPADNLYQELLEEGDICDEDKDNIAKNKKTTNDLENLIKKIDDDVELDVNDVIGELKKIEGTDTLISDIVKDLTDIYVDIDISQLVEKNDDIDKDTIDDIDNEIKEIIEIIKINIEERIASLSNKINQPPKRIVTFNSIKNSERYGGGKKYLTLHQHLSDVFHEFEYAPKYDVLYLKYKSVKDNAVVNGQKNINISQEFFPPTYMYIEKKFSETHEHVSSRTKKLDEELVALEYSEEQRSRYEDVEQSVSQYQFVTTSRLPWWYEEADVIEFYDGLMGNHSKIQSGPAEWPNYQKRLPYSFVNRVTNIALEKIAYYSEVFRDGLSLENLPKGFYLIKNKQHQVRGGRNTDGDLRYYYNELLLDYDETLLSENKTTPLTLQLQLPSAYALESLSKDAFRCLEFMPINQKIFSPIIMPKYSSRGNQEELLNTIGKVFLMIGNVNEDAIDSFLDELGNNVNDDLVPRMLLVLRALSDLKRNKQEKYKKILQNSKLPVSFENNNDYLAGTDERDYFEHLLDDIVIPSFTKKAVSEESKIQAMLKIIAQYNRDERNILIQKLHQNNNQEIIDLYNFVIGVVKLSKQSEVQFAYDNKDHVFYYLLQSKYPSEYQNMLNDYHEIFDAFSYDNLKALCSILDSANDEGLEKLIQFLWMIKAIKDKENTGEHDFETFKRCFLDTSNNFLAFMEQTAKSEDDMDEIVIDSSEQTNDNKHYNLGGLDCLKRLNSLTKEEMIWWNQLTYQHCVDAGGYPDFTLLFNAFIYFVDELKKLGITLTEICPITGAKNLQITLQRFLSILHKSHLSNQEQFNELLKYVKYDNSNDKYTPLLRLSDTGDAYAIMHHQYKFVTKEMELCFSDVPDHTVDVPDHTVDLTDFYLSIKTSDRANEMHVRDFYRCIAQRPLEQDKNSLTLTEYRAIVSFYQNEINDLYGDSDPDSWKHYLLPMLAYVDFSDDDRNNVLEKFKDYVELLAGLKATDRLTLLKYFASWANRIEYDKHYLSLKEDRLPSSYSSYSFLFEEQYFEDPHQNRLFNCMVVNDFPSLELLTEMSSTYSELDNELKPSYLIDSKLKHLEKNKNNIQFDEINEYFNTVLLNDFSDRLIKKNKDYVYLFKYKLYRANLYYGFFDNRSSLDELRQFIKDHIENITHLEICLMIFDHLIDRKSEVNDLSRKALFELLKQGKEKLYDNFYRYKLVHKCKIYNHTQDKINNSENTRIGKTEYILNEKYYIDHKVDNIVKGEESYDFGQTTYNQKQVNEKIGHAKELLDGDTINILVYDAKRATEDVNGASADEIDILFRRTEFISNDKNNIIKFLNKNFDFNSFAHRFDEAANKVFGTIIKGGLALTAVTNSESITRDLVGLLEPLENAKNEYLEFFNSLIIELYNLNEWLTKKKHLPNGTDVLSEILNCISVDKKYGAELNLLYVKDCFDLLLQLKQPELNNNVEILKHLLSVSRGVFRAQSDMAKLEKVSSKNNDGNQIGLPESEFFKSCKLLLKSPIFELCSVESKKTLISIAALIPHHNVGDLFNKVPNDLMTSQSMVSGLDLMLKGMIKVKEKLLPTKNALKIESTLHDILKRYVEVTKLFTLFPDNNINDDLDQLLVDYNPLSKINQFYADHHHEYRSLLHILETIYKTDIKKLKVEVEVEAEVEYDGPASDEEVLEFENEDQDENNSPEFKLNAIAYITARAIEESFAKKGNSNQNALQLASAVAQNLGELKLDNIIDIVQVYEKSPSPDIFILSQYLKANAVDDFIRAYSQYPIGRNHKLLLESQFNLSSVYERVNQIKDLKSADTLVDGIKKQILIDVEKVNRYGYSVNIAPTIKKPLYLCTKDELTEIKDYLMNDDGVDQAEKQLQYLALVREFIYREMGIFASSTQIMDIISLSLNTYNVAQIPTGEGKTLISILLALMAHIRRENANIVTASNFLADEAFKRYEPTLSKLGINVAQILSDSKITTYDDSSIRFMSRESYAHFQLSAMSQNHDDFIQSDESKAKTTAHIYDEIDSAVYDDMSSYNWSVPLKETERVPESMYKHILHFIKSSDFKPKDSDEYREKQDREEDILKAIEYLKQQDPPQFKKYDAEQYRDMVDLWIYSACVAESLIEGKDYVIHELDKTQKIEGQTKRRAEIGVLDSNGFSSTKPLFLYEVSNFLITIVNQSSRHSKKYDDALPIYVELKPQSAIKASMTNADLIKSSINMGGSIVCMSGTPFGSQKEIGQFEKQFAPTNNKSWNMRKYPHHNPKQRNRLPAKYVKTEKDKLNYLLKQVKECQRKGQPVLIFAEDIPKANQRYKDLSEQNIANLNLCTAESGDPEYVVNELAGKPGAVTIATDLIGRGADLQTEVESGIFVIVDGTCNNRNFQQKLSRTGRYGKKGAGMQILSEEELKKNEIIDQHDSIFIYPESLLLEKIQGKHEEMREECQQFNNKISAVSMRLYRKYCQLRQNLNLDDRQKFDIGWNLLSSSMRFKWDQMLDSITESELNHNAADNLDDDVDMHTLLGNYIQSISDKWNEFISTFPKIEENEQMQVDDLRKEIECLDISAVNDNGKPKFKSQSQYKVYHSNTDGRPSLFKQRFSELKSTLAFKRKPFANTIATLKGQGTLFANTKAENAGFVTRVESTYRFDEVNVGLNGAVGNNQNDEAIFQNQVLHSINIAQNDHQLQVAIANLRDNNLANNPIPYREILEKALSKSFELKQIKKVTFNTYAETLELYINQIYPDNYNRDDINRVEISMRLSRLTKILARHYHHKNNAFVPTGIRLLERELACHQSLDLNTFVNIARSRLNTQGFFLQSRRDQRVSEFYQLLVTIGGGADDDDDNDNNNSSGRDKLYQSLLIENYLNRWHIPYQSIVSDQCNDMHSQMRLQ